MREEWNGLLAASASNSPMLTWEWLYTWWETYRTCGVTRELCLLAARHANGSLAGLAPLVLRPFSQFGISRVRLEFLGTGEPEADETCSEYLDVIVSPDRREEVVAGLADYLAQHADWEELLARDVRTDIGAAATQLAERLASRGLVSSESRPGQAPYIRLPDSWDAYLASLSRNGRKQLRSKRRQFETRGAAAFRSALALPEIRRMFPEFVRLHRLRWQAAGKPGCFASSHFSRFLEAVTARLSERGGVQVSWLELDGEPVALYYLLRHADALFYYNSGMDIERFGELSPGNVCLSFIIEQAVTDGIREFHFLKGGAESYKYRWTDLGVPLTSVLLRRKGWKQTLCRSLARAKDRVAPPYRRVRRLLSRGARCVRATSC
ncbi:MAG: GNAT family N-acetyltransferase [Kiritimatiellae bacterium]|nr:GNAT family N-acetyltransferase [Kiritimatiellia bacterium]